MVTVGLGELSKKKAVIQVCDVPLKETLGAFLFFFFFLRKQAVDFVGHSTFKMVCDP